MNNLVWPYPAIVAHRGGGTLAPENTLAAIDYGHKFGHRMIEFDAKLSNDLQVFLLHDDELDRTTDQQGIAGSRMWHQLRQADAGSWYSDKFRGEPLPTLEEVAERCARYQLWANIEIKPTTGMERLTGEKVAEAALRLWSTKQLPLLSSFSIEALAEAQRVAPQLPRGLLLDEWREDWLELVRQLNCVAIHLNYQCLTAERIAAIKQQGLRILAYTVNQPDQAAALLNLGVDMICTDRIDLIDADFAANFTPRDCSLRS